MPKHLVSDLDHPLLEPYRAIRSRNWIEQSGIFIAEGPFLVEKLLSSDYHSRSVLIDKKYQDRFVPLVPPGVDAIIVEHAIVKEIVGFDFHRGVMGCGLRKPRRYAMQAIQSLAAHETLLAVVGVEDSENLGSIFRSCAALGIRQVLVGPGTADPLSRRSLRVSMGNCLSLDLLSSTDVVADLQWLWRERHVESIATCLSSDSQRLEAAMRSGPVILLVGNECHGLPTEIVDAASRRVRIDMELDTDSLNVAVAFSIIAHYFCRIAPQVTLPGRATDQRQH